MTVRATPAEALAAILAGGTVRLVVGPEPGDPTCLHYLDRCYEDFDKLFIYTESIGGWSVGIKEAVCAPDDSFYVEFVGEDGKVLTITNEEPPKREAEGPLTWRAGR